MIASLVLSVVVGRALQSIVDDRRVFAFFSDLEMHAQLTNDYAEVAAFLVRDDDGNLRCLRWPATNQYQMQTYRGTIPSGTIAIAHTHPPSATWPSSNDVAQAMRMDLPIFVVTRSRVTAVDSSGAKTLIEQGRWPTQPSRGRCATIVRGNATVKE